jgi:hypothetical protein
MCINILLIFKSELKNSEVFMKVEYPPLLGLGFHPTTIEDLRKLCVDAFPLSKKRPDIMDNLETVLSELTKHKIEGEVWIDGSFTTEKIEPEDSDILVYVSGEFLDNATPEQHNLIATISSNLKAKYMCDSYVLPYYPEGHQWYNEVEWWKAYWIRQFGFTRKDEPKGIAVVRL